MADLSKREWEKYGNEKDARLCMHVSAMQRKGIQPPELMQKYADWAQDGKYDEDLVQKNIFYGPGLVAEAFADTIKKPLRPNYRILDIGAGTGLVAEKLKDIGFSNIDALDPSKEMLDEARKKCVYKQFYNHFLTEARLPIENDTYDGISACGCFLEGHIQCAGLHEMIRLVKPGGVIIILTRYEYLQTVDEFRDRLEPLMDQLETEGKWKKISRQIKHKYYLDKEAIVWIYQVL